MSLMIAQSLDGSNAYYLPSFGNNFETEALPGARNAPTLDYRTSAISELLR